MHPIRMKLCSDTCTVLLGYSQTMKNIFYYDQDSHQVKTALHVVFTEAMSNSDVKSPNAQLLCSNTVPPTDIIDTTSGLPFLESQPHLSIPWPLLTWPYNLFDMFPFGIKVSTCMQLHCAYISSLSWPPLDYTLCTACCTLLSSYVLSIKNQSVISTCNIDTIHTLLHSSGQQHPTSIIIALAPEWQSFVDDCPLSTQLWVHDLQHISAWWLLMRQGITVEFNLSLSNQLNNLSTDHMEFTITLIMTEQEHTLPKLTCLWLHTLPNWCGMQHVINSWKHTMLPKPFWIPSATRMDTWYMP